MGKQKNNDPTAVNSSIALLQERFKQLERVKMMREERDQLLRGFATATEEAKRPSRPVARGGKPNWFLHTEPVSGHSPSLWLNTGTNRYDRTEFQALETSLSMQNCNSVGETEDVDTDLHL